MRPKAFLAVGLSLIFACAQVVPATSPVVVGRISARGAVEVNGTLMPSEAAMFSGDRIATRRDAVVTLAVKGGGQVFLPALSAAQVNRNANGVVITLERGALAVASRPSETVMIDAGGVRIHAAGSYRSVYEVALNGKGLRVLAHKGAAVVTAADRTLEVKEGMLLNATLGATEQGPAGVTAGLTPLERAALVIAVASGVTALALSAVTFTRSDPADCRVVSPSLAIVCN